MQNHPSFQKYKHRVAALMQEHQIINQTLVMAYRRVQARYTAGVVGVLQDEQERVLLVKHVFHERPWGLPGGWLGRRENPLDAIVREYQEETTLRIQPIRPLLVQNTPRWRNHLDMAFWVRALDVQGPLSAQPLALSAELIAYEWVALDALPPLQGFHYQALQAFRQQLEGQA